MKKILLGLGTISAVTAPVVSVVACGHSLENDKTPIASYDSKTKIITWNYKNNSRIFKETDIYKDAEARLKTAIDKYNSSKDPADEMIARSIWEGIKRETDNYYRKTSVGETKDKYEELGASIRNHPDAIGVLVKNEGETYDYEDGKNLSHKDTSEMDTLLTFNYGKASYDSDYDFGYEAMSFKFGEEFKIPEHVKWTTAGEWLKEMQSREYDKILNSAAKNVAGAKNSHSPSDLKTKKTFGNIFKEATTNPTLNIKDYIYFLSNEFHYVDDDSQWFHPLVD